ncbi:MAG: hypothetical protein A2W90_05850 [Bacteroidetes bacterium GWF2_42_66]|nr:MAG: hypothetical protein A2W92_01230 [Bacteroidetes bacterium GWA2_42_15]OFY03567.1 MAG: hypothetical protein A2W89_18575 [Bacteroidetes bacterium GWE2_42_39]OFY45932.1 MAG: hypothetical protein A2W90_05850 [Bacteroidetes bacterium GWF2_42_66]HBL75174.1 hypothetical protein [Prolixibacteraceae bacterium]HCR89725.1 hypothetical protein [Prolixibacteraceae bacterium]
MKQKITILFFTGIIGLVFNSCEKNNLDSVKGNVEFFLLESYETIGNSCQIDESTVITKAEPLISYADLISYNPDHHVFELSSEAKAAIQNIHHTVFGNAFAIKADNILIYTGYFWPGYSSLGCNWVTIDPLMIGLDNAIEVKLGYPGTIQGQEFEDRRNDQRILNIFKRDHKLED